MRWYEQPEVLAYVINAYAGTEGQKRQYIWEDLDGNIVIGNSRAFADHLGERFGLKLKPTTWMDLHELLRALGEVLHVHAPHITPRGKKFKNQLPETRIIKRKA